MDDDSELDVPEQIGVTLCRVNAVIDTVWADDEDDETEVTEEQPPPEPDDAELLRQAEEELKKLKVSDLLVQLLYAPTIVLFSYLLWISYRKSRQSKIQSDDLPAEAA